MTRELRKIMRELDEELGIVDPQIKTPQERSEWLEFDDPGIPMLQRKSVNFTSVWMDI